MMNSDSHSQKLLSEKITILIIVLFIALFHAVVLPNQHISAASSTKKPLGLGKNGKAAANSKTFAGVSGTAQTKSKSTFWKKALVRANNGLALIRVTQGDIGGVNTLRDKKNGWLGSKKNFNEVVSEAASFNGITDYFVNPDSVSAGTISTEAKKKIAERNAEWERMHKENGKNPTKQQKLEKTRKRQPGVILKKDIETTKYSNTDTIGTVNPRSVDKEYAQIIPENGNIQIITYVDKKRIDTKGNKDARIGNVEVKIERLDGEDPDCSNRTKKSGKTNNVRYKKDGKTLIKGTINWRGCATGKYKASLIGREGYDNVDKTSKEFTLSDDETQIIKFVLKKAGDPDTIIVE